MKAHLRVVEGRPLGAVIPLRGEAFVIGRDPECNLRPKHASVAPKHCTLSLEGDSLSIRDLGTDAGTLLNGRKLRPKEAVLAGHGDHLTVGNLVFEIALEKLQAAKDPASSSVMDDLDLAEDSPSSSAYRLIQKSLSEGSDPIKSVGAHLHAEMIEGIPTVAIEMDRVVSDSATLALWRELRDLAERPSLNRLVLNFHRVKELSPAAAEVIARFHQRMQARKATLKFCDLSHEVMQALDATGVTARVPVFLDCHDAVWSPW